jgi:hypothetical protein
MSRSFPYANFLKTSENLMRPIISEMDSTADAYMPEDDPEFVGPPSSLANKSLLDNRYLMYGGGGALAGAGIGALINKLRGGSALKGGLIGGGIGAGLGLGGAGIKNYLENAAIEQNKKEYGTYQKALKYLAGKGIDLSGYHPSGVRRMAKTMMQDEGEEYERNRRDEERRGGKTKAEDEKAKADAEKAKAEASKKSSANIAYMFKASAALDRANQSLAVLLKLAEDTRSDSAIMTGEGLRGDLSSAPTQAAVDVAKETGSINPYLLYGGGGALAGAGIGALINKLRGKDVLKGSLIGAGIGGGTGLAGTAIANALEDAAAYEDLRNRGSLRGMIPSGQLDKMDRDALRAATERYNDMLKGHGLDPAAVEAERLKNF